MIMEFRLVLTALVSVLMTLAGVYYYQTQSSPAITENSLTKLQSEIQFLRDQQEKIIARSFDTISASTTLAEANPIICPPVPSPTTIDCSCPSKKWSSHDELQKYWKQEGDNAGTDKVTRHVYDAIYGKYITLAMQNDPTATLVEIGGYMGASGKMWRSMFPEATIIVIDRDTQPIQHDEHTQIWPADISNQDSLNELRDKLKPLRPMIIVEDSSHVPEHQHAAFATLFSSLRDGGIYIVEDIETSFYNAGTPMYGYPLSGDNFLDRAIHAAFATNYHIHQHRMTKNNLRIEDETEIAEVSFAYNCVIFRKLSAREREHRATPYTPANLIAAAQTPH